MVCKGVKNVCPNTGDGMWRPTCPPVSGYMYIINELPGYTPTNMKL